MDVVAVIDIDEMFESIDHAKLKTQLVIALSIMVPVIIFNFFWMFLLWDMTTSFIWSLPFLILFQIILHLKREPKYKSFFLSDEDKKFIDAWDAFEKSKKPDYYKEFNEYLEENK